MKRMKTLEIYIHRQTQQALPEYLADGLFNPFKYIMHKVLACLVMSKRDKWATHGHFVY